MPTSSSRTFKSGNSEAVRLPRDVAFGPDTELTIVRSGDVLTMYPTRQSISSLAKRLAELPQPVSVELRDEEPMPERSGL